MLEDAATSTMLQSIPPHRRCRILPQRLSLGRSASLGIKYADNVAIVYDTANVAIVYDTATSTMPQSIFLIPQRLSLSRSASLGISMPTMWP
jgi:hypothetical protein